jgi:DNA-binding SARP family transcriptional activator/predicted ATPase
MTKLVVRLLGGYRVELDGKAVYDFETNKARALLAYLVVEADRPHRREALAGLLWPERPDTVARTNLRQALARVRRALSDYAPPFFLFITPTDVQFNTASDYTLDVVELAAFVSSQACQHQLLPTALCADFLDGFVMPDSESFEEWVLSRQEHYHRLAMETLETQNAYFEMAGDYAQAAAAARLQLKLEPWLEEAHRRCMRALALAGRRDEALHQYEVCRHALQSELGVEPASNTQTLYADILAEKVVAMRPSQTVVAAGAARPAGSSGPAFFLPARLVAREDELGQLSGHLQAALAGETRVAFVSGDAGSGKTMLLEVFAASAMAVHRDLLVAGARCSPGGGLDPLAPLRKVMEMLCGDLASDVAWRLPSEHQLDRLQRASGFILASLAERGPGLVDTLVPAASLARRARMVAPWVAAEPPWSAPLPAKPAPSALSAREALFDQMICTLAAVARTAPLLLLFDDLQWVDEASAAFLARIGRELEGSRLLILGAFRSATVELGRRDGQSPEAGGDTNGDINSEIKRHPLAAVINELRRSRGEITINLDRADGRALVEALVDTEPNRLGARFRDALYMQTGGHALFTVELLRSLRERGEIFKDAAGRWTAPATLEWGPLPAKVDGAIAERIERLPAVCRRILACASVQGDDFSGEATAELAGVPAAGVLTCLSDSLARRHHLVRPEGLQWLRGGQQSMYRFSHHLFQKYLYDQLDAVERARLHAEFAAALERQIADDQAERERISAILAWHYEEGGQWLQAARALYDAGRQAMRVSAYPEASNLFKRALALLAHTPPSHERSELELHLQVAQLGPQRNAEGLTGAGLARMLARATQAGVNEVQGWARLMMLEFQIEPLVAQGQFDAALAVAAQILERAMQADEEAFVAVSHWQFGFIYNLMGKPREAEGHLNRVLTWLTPERRTELRATLGTDFATPALCFSALDLWWLGFPDQALARSASAVTWAQEQEDTFGLATACAIGATVLFLMRDDGAALQEWSELCHCLSMRHGFAMWQLYAEVFLGRLAILRGEEEAGLKQMRHALAGWQAMGMTIGTDILVLVLVDGCLVAAQRHAQGDHAQRDKLLSIALTAIDSVIGPPCIPCGQSYAAELHRLRGELHLMRGGPAAGEAVRECFRMALALAQEQGALGWELRVIMSLVRLREQQGEPCAAELAEARRTLSDLYAQYSEGFTSPDLQDAAALIGVTVEPAQGAPACRESRGSLEALNARP